MFRTAAAAIAAVCTCLSAPAFAHVIAGNRVFPVTLTVDDPGVADEVSLPAFQYTRDGIDSSGRGPTHQFAFGFEYDKTITSNTALIVNDGYTVQHLNGAKTQAGWQNLVITGKWQAYTNAEHEFVASLGIIRGIGGTSTEHIGGDKFGSTAPTGYFGKGFGDIPVPFLRPFAVTGELSYVVADVKLKQIQVQPPLNVASAQSTGIASQFNLGANNAWSGGLTVQYSLPYLQSQVKDVGLGGFFGNLIPLVEMTWTSPAGKPSNLGTTFTAAPGVIYLAQWGEIGVEALIPLNRTTGTTLGAVALVHVFLDDLLPNTLGKPIFN